MAERQHQAVEVDELRETATLLRERARQLDQHGTCAWMETASWSEIAQQCWLDVVALEAEHRDDEAWHRFVSAVQEARHRPASAPGEF
jgi:hypothetical protein